jgi:thioredoxin 1
MAKTTSKSYKTMNSFTLVVLVAMVVAVHGFGVQPSRWVARAATHLEAVTEVGSPEEFDAALASAADSVVVVDYSTTWCGPCKFILPKFEELSDKYENVVFLKCIGDTSTEASKLMKREGVRSVPAFHIWKAGGRIDTVNGARIDEVEDCIKSNQ